MIRDWSVRLAVWGLLALGPFVLTDFGVFLVPQILTMGLVAASLDLLVGYTGLISLGHATYFGVGAYAAGLTAVHWSGNAFAQIALAIAVASFVALVTGWLAVRTRGVYFLMLTLAFAELAFSLALTWTPVTGGSNGLSGIRRASIFPGSGAETLSSDTSIYYYVLAGFIVGYLFLRRIAASPFGRSLQGIRENENRMRSLGYSVVGYKLGAFVLAGGVAGYAGALFVQHDRFIAPSNISFQISVFALIMVILGGVGTLYGAVLGAAMVLILRDQLSSVLVDRWEFALGILFVLVVYLLPKGMAGLLKDIKRQASLRLLSRPENP